MQEIANKNAKKCISYECIDCCFITNNKTNYNKHLMTSKHINRKKSQKIAKREENSKQHKSYECIECCIITNNKYDYNKHLRTIKHLENCKKEKESENKSEINENLFEKLIKTLIEQNKESQEKLIEIVKDGKTINNTINNNSFNLNFFLNETCKDAISIEDCINSIEVTDDKFYLFGEKKSIRGLSKIINYTIDKLSEIKRPVHCLDQKRDEYAIKLNNGWTRDETEYTPVVNRSISYLKDKYMNYGCGTIQHKVQESDSKIIKYTKCMIELTQKVQIKDFLKNAFNEKIINKKKQGDSF